MHSVLSRFSNVVLKDDIMIKSDNRVAVTGTTTSVTSDFFWSQHYATSTRHFNHKATRHWNRLGEHLPNVAVRMSGGVKALSNVNSFRANSDFSFHDVRWGFTSVAATVHANTSQTV